MDTGSEQYRGDGWRGNCCGAAADDAEAAMTPAPNGVRINVARGLASLAEQACRRVRGGSTVWDGGLGEVVKQAIAESPDVPKEDITPVELARRMGILQPAPKGKKVPKIGKVTRVR
jgi:hypothetical protein